MHLHTHIWSGKIRNKENNDLQLKKNSSANNDLLLTPTARLSPSVQYFANSFFFNFVFFPTIYEYKDAYLVLIQDLYIVLYSESCFRSQKKTPKWVIL